MLLQQLSIKVELNKETEKSFECELGKQYSITTTGVANDFSKTREAILYKSNKRFILSAFFSPRKSEVVEGHNLQHGWFRFHNKVAEKEEWFL